jgi:hypothetical protein
MTIRKLAIIGVIIVLFCMPSFGQNKSTFRLLVYSGMTVPSYPSTGFASFFRPSQNFGIGLNYQLSPKLSLHFDFSHYQFQPKSKLGWRLVHDAYGITFEKSIYSSDIIEADYDRNDLLLELKLKPFQNQKRFSPYILAGAGAAFTRIEAYRFGFDSKSWYKSTSIHYLITAGIGFDYRIDNKIDVFMEVCYNYSFLDNKKKTKGVIPLKLGIALGL